MPINPLIQMSGPRFSIRASGDGYELLDAKGEVIAWTLDRKWACRILMALEFAEVPTMTKNGDHK
jgi:hypothetical protein